MKQDQKQIDFESAYNTLMAKVKDVLNITSPGAIKEEETLDFLPIGEAIELMELIYTATLYNQFDIEATRREYKSLVARVGGSTDDRA